MKRIVAILLVVALLLGCGVFTASAESSKLLPDLQKVLIDKAPGDEIGVYISYNVPVVTAADMPSWPDIYTARKEYFAYSDKMQEEIQAEIFEGIDVRIGFQGVHNMVIAHVKVSDIEKIASYDIVRDIDYLDDRIIETDADEYATQAKLTDELRQKMAKYQQNDDICVSIAYNVPSVNLEDMPSWPDEKAAYADFKSLTKQQQSEIQGIIFADIDNKGVVFDKMPDSLIVLVRVGDIEKIAAHDEVREISYCENIDNYFDIPAGYHALEPYSRTHELWESGAELTSEDIVEAINENFHSDLCHVGADSITVKNSYRFKSAPAYIVDYEVGEYGIFNCVEVELEQYMFGDYLFYSCCSYEPSIFVNDRLYTLTNAYKGGYITEEMLEELIEADYKCGSYGVYCRIIARNIKGDADGDGKCTIIDATMIQRHEAGVAVNSFFKPLADVNGDSEANIIDVTLIQRSQAGIYTIE